MGQSQKFLCEQNLRVNLDPNPKELSSQEIVRVQKTISKLRKSIFSVCCDQKWHIQIANDRREKHLEYMDAQHLKKYFC